MNQSRARSQEPEDAGKAVNTPAQRASSFIDASAKPPLSIPPILLEGDEPSKPAPNPATLPISKPAPANDSRKASTKPNAEVTEHEEPARVEDQLPEAYGTGKLRLASRDPHWLYVHWDLTSAQQRRYASHSAHRQLTLRILEQNGSAKPVMETRVHPDSQHCFVHVGRGGMTYLAELGYYKPDRLWERVALSDTATTPPETVAEDNTVRYATISPDQPLGEGGSVRGEVRSEKPAGQGLKAERRGAGVVPEVRTELTLEQTRALAEALAILEAGERQGEAGAIAEKTEGPFDETSLFSENLQPATQAGESSWPGGISSPRDERPEAPGGFWFTVNAELVVYGATEPDALVTIGGQPVALREDGSFSYRVALPDGQRELVVTATSSRGDVREARMQFVRKTTHGQGEGPS